MHPFSSSPTLIGMVHLPALPGSPAANASIEDVCQQALRDALALAEGGADAVLLENFGDTPFHPETNPPHTIAQMTRIASELRGKLPRSVALGINILRNDAVGALSVAAASGATFIRVNVHSGVVATDQGLLQGQAHRTMRLRRELGVDVAVFADVAVKHGYPLGNGRCPSMEATELIGRGMADGVIVSGQATSAPVSVAELEKVAAAVGPEAILLGSGVTTDTARGLLRYSCGAIVGTAIKKDGKLHSPVDANRVRAMAAAFRMEQ